MRTAGEFDVAIVGAGLTGVLAAWTALARNLRVVLIDSRAEPGSGTSFTSGGSISLQDKSTKESLDLALTSIDLYKSIAGRSGGQFGGLVRWCGGLIPFWNEAERSRCIPILDRIERQGIKIEEVAHRSLVRQFPALSHNLNGGFYCKAEGRTEPHRLAKALVTAMLNERSALIRWAPFESVTGIDAVADGLTIHCRHSTGATTFRTQSVVLATGAYNNEIAWPVERSIRPRRGLILSFDAAADLDTVMHGCAYVGQRESTDSALSVAFSFEQRQGMWRIGSSREVVGRVDHGIETVITRIRREAEQYLPALTDRTIRSVDVCFRPLAEQGEAYITRGSGVFSNVVSINGQEGEGITLAPALAKLAIDQLE